MLTLRSSARGNPAAPARPAPQCTFFRIDFSFTALVSNRGASSGLNKGSSDLRCWQTEMVVVVVVGGANVRCSRIMLSYDESHRKGVWSHYLSQCNEKNGLEDVDGV
jgi:hypothetical protein